MHVVRLTPSRALRWAVFGALAGPLCLAWGVVSCILDPPPGLPIIPPSKPVIRAIYPPQSSFTDWPVGGLNFVIQAQLLNPNDTLLLALLEDADTAASTVLPLAKDSAQSPDGGPITLTINVPAPNDSNCHTYTLFADTNEDPSRFSVLPGPPGSVSCSADLCASYTWIYQPPGARSCPVFDATPDAGKDARPRTHD